MNHPKRLLVFLLALAVITAAGCNAPGTRNAGNANVAAPSNANAGTAPAASDPQALDALTKAMTAQLNARSFRARSDRPGQETSTIIEFVAPDRLHVTSDEDEIIIVGANAWDRKPGGEWQKFPMDVSQLMASIRDPEAIQAIRQNAEVKLVGPDTLDGMPMTVYEYTIRNIRDPGTTEHSKTWIAVADSLPRRKETEINANNQTVRARMTYFDYNADIQIAPPK